MVAGEASGDLLASLLLRGLRQRWPQLRAAGIGGPRMAEQGFDAWWPHELLAVFGYVDALRRYPQLLALRRRLGDRILAERPAAFVGVDAPDFNFGLETRLRAAGLRTVHFVCPSIWAWRAHRVHQLARAADHVLCLFPFEPPLLQSHGIAATYVGHPLADAIPLEPVRDAARLRLGLAPDAVVVALLPGSRRSEIELIGPRMLQAARCMQAQRAGLRFVLPALPSLREPVQALVRQHAGDAGVQVLDGQSHDALAACDVTLVASGTATLEAALLKRPMVITYAVSALNWWRMRRMALQPWVGLPNILAREFIVPELIQDAATPEALARETLAWLDDNARVQALQRRFHDLHLELRRDTASTATHALEKILQA
jgi:lipid-A-disaccharide synthase